MRMSVQGVCMSGQEPAHLQGTREWAAQAPLAERNCCRCSARHFRLCRFGTGDTLRNLKYPPQEEASGVPAPQNPDVSLTLHSGRAVHPTAATSQDPGTMVLTGEGAVVSEPRHHGNHERDRI